MSIATISSPQTSTSFIPATGASIQLADLSDKQKEYLFENCYEFGPRPIAQQLEHVAHSLSILPGPKPKDHHDVRVLLAQVLEELQERVMLQFQVMVEARQDQIFLQVQPEEHPLVHLVFLVVVVSHYHKKLRLVQLVPSELAGWEA